MGSSTTLKCQDSRAPDASVTVPRSNCSERPFRITRKRSSGSWVKVIVLCHLVKGAALTSATFRESNQRVEEPSGRRWEAFASLTVRPSSDGGVGGSVTMMQQLGVFG